MLATKLSRFQIEALANSSNFQTLVRMKHFLVKDNRVMIPRNFVQLNVGIAP